MGFARAAYSFGSSVFEFIEERFGGDDVTLSIAGFVDVSGDFGIEKITTETGAGQWGSALAFACAQFGLECGDDPDEVLLKAVTDFSIQQTRGPDYDG